jgi:hypothetical protein
MKEGNKFYLMGDCYEKIGFRKVRVNIDAWKDQLGELQSSVDYELQKANYRID